MGDQGRAEGLGLAEQDVAADVGDAVPTVTIDDLGIDAKGERASMRQVRRRSWAACPQVPKWAARA